MIYGIPSNEAKQNMAVPKGEVEEGAENIFKEIMGENFPKFEERHDIS